MKITPSVLLLIVVNANLILNVPGNMSSSYSWGKAIKANDGIYCDYG